MKGVQNFCFCQLSMQILWRRRCSRVVDLKLPASASPETEDSTGKEDNPVIHCKLVIVLTKAAPTFFVKYLFFSPFFWGVI